MRRTIRGLGVRLGVACALVSAVACGGGDDAADTSATSGALNFEAGRFDLAVYEVVDQCLDGGLELAIRSGVDCDVVDECFIEMPNPGDLPQTYTIDLQKPFEDIVVTVFETGEDSMRFEDAVQTGVVLDEETYGDCTMDLVASADILILGPDDIDFTASLDITAWHSSKSTCPEASSQPCSVKIGMKGTRNSQGHWFGGP